MCIRDRICSYNEKWIKFWSVSCFKTHLYQPVIEYIAHIVQCLLDGVSSRECKVKFTKVTNHYWPYLPLNCHMAVWYALNGTEKIFLRLNKWFMSCRISKIPIGLIQISVFFSIHLWPNYLLTGLKPSRARTTIKLVCCCFKTRCSNLVS